MVGDYEIDELRSQCEALAAERDALSEQLALILKRYEMALHENEKLKRAGFAPKRESLRAHEDQLSLLEVLSAMGRLPTDTEESTAHDDNTEIDEAAALARARELIKGKKKSARPHGRRKLSLEDLPVTRIVIEPPERDAAGGERLMKIGEEVSEHIEHTPASKRRIQFVYPKYVKPDASVVDKPLGAPLGVATPQRRFIIAERFELPLPRCMAGPGMLAQVLVSKYCDHIPLHRQERIYRREGLRIARSTLCDWVGASANLLSRIVDAMWDDTRKNASYVLTDSTGILVQEKDRCRRGNFYVVVAPANSVLFRFTADNRGETVAGVLEGFSGYVHADASAVFHELYRREEDLLEVGCWAHARRKFFDALASDPDRALIAIGYISRLFDVHRATWDRERGVADQEKRRQLARPILAKFFRWVRQELSHVDTGTPIASALGYARNQRPALLRFLEDARLRLDNNPAELQLRRLVVGRKNWLFCGNDFGAEWAATAVSLIASCEMHDIEPWAYLRDVLTLLPAWDQTRVLELAPHRWRQTVAEPRTQALLDERDPMRRAERSAPG